jgi:hypothetical protein
MLGLLAFSLFLALCGGIYRKEPSKRLTKLDWEVVRNDRFFGDDTMVRSDRKDEFGHDQCTPLEPPLFETDHECLVDFQLLTSWWRYLEYRNKCIVGNGWSTSTLALDSPHDSKCVAHRFLKYFHNETIGVIKLSLDFKVHHWDEGDSDEGFISDPDSAYFVPDQPELSSIDATPSPSPTPITAKLSLVLPDSHNDTVGYIPVALIPIFPVILIVAAVLVTFFIVTVILCLKREDQRRLPEEDISDNSVGDFSDEHVPPSPLISRSSSTVSTSNSNPSSGGYCAGDEISRIMPPVWNRSASCPHLPAHATHLYSSTDDVSSLSMSTLRSSSNCHLSPLSTSSSRNTVPILLDRSSAEGESYRDDVPNLSHQSDTGSAMSFPSTASAVSPEEEEGQVCPQVVVDQQESAQGSRSTARPTVGGFTSTSSSDSIPASLQGISKQDLPPLVCSSVDEETEC